MLHGDPQKQVSKRRRSWKFHQIQHTSYESILCQWSKNQHQLQSISNGRRRERLHGCRLRHLRPCRCFFRVTSRGSPTANSFTTGMTPPVDPNQRLLNLRVVLPSFDGFETAVSKLSNGKTPGESGVTGEAIKALPCSSLEELHRKFQLYQTDPTVVHEEWSTAILNLLYKG